MGQIALCININTAMDIYVIKGKPKYNLADAKTEGSVPWNYHCVSTDEGWDKCKIVAESAVADIDQVCTSCHDIQQMWSWSGQMWSWIKVSEKEIY